MKNNSIKKTNVKITKAATGNIQKLTDFAGNIFYNEKSIIINDCNAKKLSLRDEAILECSQNNAFKSTPTILNDATQIQASYSIAPAEIFVQALPHLLKFPL